MNVVNTRHNITDSVNTTTKRYHQLRHEPNKLVTPNYNINGENFIVNHIELEREREREREKEKEREILHKILSHMSD